MPSQPILKTYLNTDEKLSTRNTKIYTILSKSSSKPLFYICTRDGSQPQSRTTKIRAANKRHQPSVAGVRTNRAGHDIRVIAAKHPDDRERKEWTEVERGMHWDLEHPVGAREFRFEVKGKMYTWRRKAPFNSTDFKLLDARGRVLAAYIGSCKTPRLNYFNELDRQAELMSLAVLWGIQERVTLRRDESAHGGYGEHGAYGVRQSRTRDSVRAGFAHGIGRAIAKEIVNGFFGRGEKGHHSDY